MAGNEDLAAKWARLREVRRTVTGALELERAQKRIGSSLQARPQVYIDWDFEDLVAGVDMAEMTITSDIELIAGQGPEEAFRLEDVPGVAVVSRPGGRGEMPALLAYTSGSGAERRGARNLRALCRGGNRFGSGAAMRPDGKCRTR